MLLHEIVLREQEQPEVQRLVFAIFNALIDEGYDRCFNIYEATIDHVTGFMTIAATDETLGEADEIELAHRVLAHEIEKIKGIDEVLVRPTTNINQTPVRIIVCTDDDTVDIDELVDVFEEVVQLIFNHTEDALIKPILEMYRAQSH